MAGNSFGTRFRITSFGESHGKGIGVVVDGMPPGIEIDPAAIQLQLDRRKPGQSQVTTPRKEHDQVEILSGVFEGKSTGTPIAMFIANRNQKAETTTSTGTSTGLDMQISATTRNMASGTTGAVAGVREEKPRPGLPPGHLHVCSLKPGVSGSRHGPLRPQALGAKPAILPPWRKPDEGL